MNINGYFRWITANFGMKMLYVDGVHYRCYQKTAGLPQGRFVENFGFFIELWGIRNDLQQVWKCFSIGKIWNLEKNFTLDYSRVFGKIPVSRSRPEVETMTLHNNRVNSIHPQSFIQIGPRVSEIIQPTPKMNAILMQVYGVSCKPGA